MINDARTKKAYFQVEDVTIKSFTTQLYQAIIKDAAGNPLLHIKYKKQAGIFSAGVTVEAFAGCSDSGGTLLCQVNWDGSISDQQGLATV